MSRASPQGTLGHMTPRSTRKYREPLKSPPQVRPQGARPVDTIFTVVGIRPARDRAYKPTCSRRGLQAEGEANSADIALVLDWRSNPETAEILCCLNAAVQKSRTAVQQISTATSPSGTDLIRPRQARELDQWPASTSVPLVHTEGVVRGRYLDTEDESRVAGEDHGGSGGKRQSPPTCSVYVSQAAGHWLFFGEALALTIGTRPTAKAHVAIQSWKRAWSLAGSCVAITGRQTAASQMRRIAILVCQLRASLVWRCTAFTRSLGSGGDDSSRQCLAISVKHSCMRSSASCFDTSAARYGLRNSR
jgi:hypothetical protein